MARVPSHWGATGEPHDHSGCQGSRRRSRRQAARQQPGGGPEGSRRLLRGPRVRRSADVVLQRRIRQQVHGPQRHRSLSRRSARRHCPRDERGLRTEGLRDSVRRREPEAKGGVGASTVIRLQIIVCCLTLITGLLPPRAPETSPTSVAAPKPRVVAPRAHSTRMTKASGTASWYDVGKGLYGAAGPALRKGHWRGRTVSVCSGG